MSGEESTPGQFYFSPLSQGLNSQGLGQGLGKTQEAASSAASTVAQAATPVVSAVKDAFGSPHPDSAAVEDITTPKPAKQLYFGGVDPSELPATPAFTSDDDVDYNLFIKETLLWSNKFRSAFYFVLGLVLWLAVRAVFVSPITLPTGVAYLLMSLLFYNFLRGVMAPKYAERIKWANSVLVRAEKTAATGAIDAGAAVLDKHFNGLDPQHTLHVALALWGLSLLGRALPAVTLLLVLHVTAFTLPAAYLRFKTKVDAAVSDVFGKARTQYDGLGRHVKAPAIVGAMLVFGLLLPALDRLVVAAAVLIYARSVLKPAEYNAVVKRVEPVAVTLMGLGDKATSAVVTTMNKYELTPTPMKKRK